MINFGLSLSSLPVQPRHSGILLNFGGPALPNGSALTRSSDATLRVAPALYQTVSSDVARLGIDPNGSGNSGLHIESAATNLIPHSQPTAGTWSGVSATVTDRASAELGIFTGVTIASQGGNWNRAVVDNISVTNGQTYVVTTYVAAGSSGRVRIRLRDTSQGQETRVVGAFGDLSVATTTAGGAANLTETLLADGTTRLVTFEFTPDFSGLLDFGVGPDSATSGETVDLLAAQFELGTAPSSFISTGSSATTRAADLPSLTNWTGSYDVVVSFSDGSSQTFSGQTVSPGYWPSGLTGHISSIELIEL